MTRKNKDLIDKELEKLYEAGRLTKANVVKAATNPKSPLHKVIFNCSDAKAAYEHRLDRAGELIREFETKIIIRELEVTVPKYVHVKTHPGYLHINAVRNNKASAKEFMRNELTMAQALIERCYKFGLVLGFNGQLDKIHTQINAIISRL